MASVRHPIVLQEEVWAEDKVSVVTDASVSRELIVSWQSRLEDINLPPIFETLPEMLTVAGELYTYAPQVEDPNGDTVTFSIQTDIDNVQFDPVTGLITWSIPSGVGSRNNFRTLFPIELVAEDSQGESTTQKFNIVVVSSPEPPEIYRNRTIGVVNEGSSSLNALWWIHPPGEFDSSPLYFQFVVDDKKSQ